MAMFNSYVKLPEGNQPIFFGIPLTNATTVASLLEAPRRRKRSPGKRLRSWKPWNETCQKPRVLGWFLVLISPRKTGNFGKTMKGNQKPGKELENMGKMHENGRRMLEKVELMAGERSDHDQSWFSCGNTWRNEASINIQIHQTRKISHVKGSIDARNQQ